ncbi:uncharacterized protein LOC125050273 [Pieris napi]|uniref:uncharacterized protein LOC125050273 n=1 Tax=Pieris napi TaxID=78633 RepID=UPI001FB885C6|nr:uncharacterized protein LOC125050273 [Pieris napi]
MDRFDVELFIDEVEKRPAIWDIQCDDYSNKIIKNRAWQELVEIFGDCEDTLEKKNILSTQLQKKWKNIRDCYNKEYKKGKTTPSGSGARKGAQYMYFARLSFLQNSVSNKDTTTNIEEQNERQSEETSQLNANVTEATEKRPPKRKKTQVPEEKIAVLIEKSIESRKKFQDEFKENSIAKQDDDKLFCLSLFKEIKKVPENRRLATKIELLQVIQKGQILPPPVRYNTQQITPMYWQGHGQQYTSQQGYFTSGSSPPVIPSPSPSQLSSNSQSSTFIENIYADFEEQN